MLLTTQYLEEADQLADRISVLDAGRVVAEGTAEELKARIGGDRIEVVARHAAELDAVAAIVAEACGVVPETDPVERRVGAVVADRVAALIEVVTRLNAAGLAVADIGVRQPTLDEAFLHLTGHGAPREAVA